MATAPVTKDSHLYLVDASAYIFRAFHALPPLTRASDGIFIMAYDMWHGRRFCAGPNSPLAHIESNIGQWIRAGAVPAKLLQNCLAG